MPDGRTFTRGGVIHPGWELRLPLDEPAVGAVEVRTYVVQRGDTLSSIAGRMMGDEEAWPELFALNRGTARLPDGRTLTRPELIWPGLELMVPVSAGEAVSVAANVAPLPAVEAPPALFTVAAPAPDQEAALAPGAAAEAGAEAAPEALDATPVAAAPMEAGRRATTDPEAPPDVLPSPSPAPAVAEPRGAAGPAPAVGSSIPAAPATAAPVAPPEAAPAVVGTDGPARAPVAAGVAAALAAAAAAAAETLRRRRARRSLHEPPPAAAGAPARYREPVELVFAAGFAEMDVTRSLLHRLRGGEADAAVAAAGQIRRFLSDHELDALEVVTLAHGREATGLAVEATLRGPAAERERLVALAPALGALLGGAGGAELRAEGDVRLVLNEVRSTGLLTPPGQGESGGGFGEPSARQRGGAAGRILDAAAAAEAILPLGALSRRRVLSVAWGPLGHVLVAGSPGGGAGTILTSTVASLAARFRPDELRLWTIGGRRVLPPELLDLPHQITETVDPADASAMEVVVGAVRDVLVRRMRLARGAASGTDSGEGPPGPPGPSGDPGVAGPSGLPDGAEAFASGRAWPLIVVLVPELAEGLTDGGPADGGPADGGLADLLHAVAVDGPAHGIHLLAATSHAGRLDPDVVAQFTTRLVLQTEDETQSVQLTGRPDAAALERGGDLLFSVGGRAPLRLRGFRVSPPRLVELVRLLRTAFGPGAGLTPPDEPSPPPGTRPARAPDAAIEAGTAVTGPPAVPAGTAGTRAAVEAKPGAAGGAGAAGAAGGAGVAPEAEAAAVVAEEVAPESVEEGAPPGAAEGAAAEGREAPAVAPAAAPAEGSAASAAASGDVAEAAAGAEADRAGAAGGRPIEVRCFGGFEVVCGEQPLSATGQAGPRHRSWEILAFLAAQPSEVVSTEKLLAAVWPDSDTERASSAFGAALSRLRGVLTHQLPGLSGPLVWRDRVGRTCRLDGMAFACDVHAFATLCREGRRLPPQAAAEAYERARALYAGDLLKDQPYAWLHERDDDGLTLPERYREAFRLITNELAGIYVQRGEQARAVPLYRELLRSEPALEDVARRLYRCYGSLGDRVSLVREHRRLRQALLEAYGDPEDGGDPALAAPEPETVEVYEEVLAALDAGADRPAGGAAPARGAAGGADPADAGAGARSGQSAGRPAGGPVGASGRLVGTRAPDQSSRARDDLNVASRAMPRERTGEAGEVGEEGAEGRVDDAEGCAA
jgi:DNA-binding SARP family transcriptional activator